MLLPFGWVTWHTNEQVVPSIYVLKCDSPKCPHALTAFFFILLLASFGFVLRMLMAAFLS